MLCIMMVVERGRGADREGKTVKEPGVAELGGKERGVGGQSPSRLKALVKKRQPPRVRNPLVRECMAEFLGTFVLLVSGTWSYQFPVDVEDTLQYPLRTREDSTSL